MIKDLYNELVALKELSNDDFLTALEDKNTLLKARTYKTLKEHEQMLSDREESVKESLETIKENFK